MTQIPCFWLEPSERIQRDLRRYAGDSVCLYGHGYHNAEAPLDEILSPATDIIQAASHPKEDPRWPTRCQCGYEFVAEDQFQVFQRRLYKRSDTSTLVTLQEAPVGAMWDADWYPRKGPDGRCLVVMTPGGEWMVDGPSTTGGNWTRTGEVPFITATPSILITNRSEPDYHGFLTNGVLIEV